MRLGVAQFGVAALAAGLAAACSAAVTDRSAKLGCGPIDGLGVLTAENAPAYVLIGEPVETNEAPGAFAELACQLAARQPETEPLWVGVSDYMGGSTAAVDAMRVRLKGLIAKGAPIVVGNATTGHTTGASRRDEAERRWAETILASMKSSGASRALLLLPRRNAVAATVKENDARFADYTPMALFLPGQVLSLEIRPAVNIGAPTIRIYREITAGYMGQLSLATVTPAEKIAPAPRQSPAQ